MEKRIGKKEGQKGKCGQSSRRNNNNVGEMMVIGKEKMEEVFSWMHFHAVSIF